MTFRDILLCAMSMPLISMKVFVQYTPGTNYLDFTAVCRHLARISHILYILFSSRQLALIGYPD